MKKCSKCKIDKPFDQFTKRGAKYVSSTPGGDRQTYCKSCESDYNREYRARNKNHRKAQVRERRYGITNEKYQQLLAEQNFCCASCNDPFGEIEKHIHVDHCHKTKVVRGILCHHCNVALGHLKDDPKRIHNLLTYLEKSYVAP